MLFSIRQWYCYGAVCLQNILWYNIKTFATQRRGLIKMCQVTKEDWMFLTDLDDPEYEEKFTLLHF